MQVVNRWQAFGIHLIISLLIFIILASVIYFWWYPGLLFLYDGGMKGLQLMAGVDFLVGPILTLCVYKYGKKSLVFDLSCIALVQLMCLMGGMYVVGKTRPVAIVYVADSFTTTNQIGYEVQGYDVGQIDILKKRWPIWLAIDIPDGGEKNFQQLSAITGEPFQYDVTNYIGYSEKTHRLPYFGFQASDVADSTRAMRDLETTNDKVRFFFMTTSLYVGYLAVDVNTGEALDFFVPEA